MEWFEYIFALGAIALVILPFILSKLNKKKGKSSCCGCNGCPSRNSCAKQYQLQKPTLKNSSVLNKTK